MTPRLGRDTGERVESNVWYLDNGASNHMTGHRSKFRDLDEGVTGRVRFGDGSTVDIKGKGTVYFKCKNVDELAFKEVYYIPELCNNIVSLGQLSEAGNEVLLKGEFMWIYGRQKKLIMKFKRSENRLYKILLETSNPGCLMSKVEDSTWLWHARLGHVNFHAMQMLSTKHMARGLPEFQQPKEVCVGCLMSKQTRRPFPQQIEFHATRALELIHGDLCGLITPATAGGNRYFLLLVDDFNRLMWTYMLKNKDEALDAFKQIRVLLEKDSEKKIKIFRTDRGGEFVSKNFVDIMIMQAFFVICVNTSKWRRQLSV